MPKATPCGPFVLGRQRSGKSGDSHEKHPDLGSCRHLSVGSRIWPNQQILHRKGTDGDEHVEG